MKIKIDDLRPHEEQEKMYGNDLDLNEVFIKAIEERGGFLEKVVVTHDNRIVSGNRRIGAARKLGWTEVEVEVFESHDEKEIVKALLCYNMHRVKTTLTMVRESMGYLAIFEEEGRKAMSQGGVKSGKVRGGEGSSEFELPSPEGGKSTGKIAKSLDIKESKAFRLVQIGKELEAAEDAGDSGKVDRIKKALSKSVHAACLLLKPPSEIKANRPKPPTPNDWGVFPKQDKIIIPLKTLCELRFFDSFGEVINDIVEMALDEKRNRPLHKIPNKYFVLYINTLIDKWREA